MQELYLAYYTAVQILLSFCLFESKLISEFGMRENMTAAWNVRFTLGCSAFTNKIHFHVCLTKKYTGYFLRTVIQVKVNLHAFCFLKKSFLMENFKGRLHPYQTIKNRSLHFVLNKISNHSVKCF